MITEQNIGGLIVFGAFGFTILGILMGIVIKHFIDLPYILAVKYSQSGKEAKQ